MLACAPSCSDGVGHNGRSEYRTGRRTDYCITVGGGVAREASHSIVLRGDLFAPNLGYGGGRLAGGLRAERAEAATVVMVMVIVRVEEKSPRGEERS